jgi:hypothetical protein
LKGLAGINNLPYIYVKSWQLVIYWLRPQLGLIARRPPAFHLIVAPRVKLDYHGQKRPYPYPCCCSVQFLLDWFRSGRSSRIDGTEVVAMLAPYFLQEKLISFRAIGIVLLFTDIEGRSRQQQADDNVGIRT